MSASNTHTLQTVTTRLSPDTIETYPTLFNNELLVACGMYHLEDKGSAVPSRAGGGVRVGEVCLYTLDPDLGADSSLQLQPLSHISCSGVLDMKWLPSCLHKCLLATAQANGSVCLYEADSDGGCKLERSIWIRDSPILLSLDHQRFRDLVMCSDSTGYVYECNLEYPPVAGPVCSWKAHDYECWVVFSDPVNDYLIYTGGDDKKLHLWDIRQDSKKPVWSYTEHNSGVCSILNRPGTNCQILSGSYDQHIHLVDKRSFKPVYIGCVNKLDIGGGVWRMKWQSQREEGGSGVHVGRAGGDEGGDGGDEGGDGGDKGGGGGDKPLYLAAAGMHDGFHIVSLQQDTLYDVASYHGHDSLAYGISWLPVKTQSPDISYLVSCSFYDRKLCMWQWQLG